MAVARCMPLSLVTASRRTDRWRRGPSTKFVRPIAAPPVRSATLRHNSRSTAGAQHCHTGGQFPLQAPAGSGKPFRRPALGRPEELRQAGAPPLGGAGPPAVAPAIAVAGPAAQHRRLDCRGGIAHQVQVFESLVPAFIRRRRNDVVSIQSRQWPGQAIAPRDAGQPSQGGAERTRPDISCGRSRQRLTSCRSAGRRPEQGHTQRQPGAFATAARCGRTTMTTRARGGGDGSFATPAWP